MAAKKKLVKKKVGKSSKKKLVKKPKRVCKICVPCYKGDISKKLKAFIKDLMKNPFDKVVFSYGAYSGITPDLSRNEAIVLSNKLKPEINEDFFYLCDADMLPTRAQFKDLMDCFLEGKYHVLGAVYKKNIGSGSPAYNVQIQEGISETKLLTGVIPVFMVGAGALFVHGDIFRNMEKPYFNDYWSQDKDLGIFNRTPGDLNFCSKVRSLGVRVYCNFDIEIHHDIIPVKELDKLMGLD